MLNPALQQAITEILQPDEIIYADSHLYEMESKCWVVQKDFKPPVVLRPKSLSSLQQIVGFLCSSNLDFGVRCAGVGSSSGRDCIISMAAFNDFKFDAEKEEVVIGAGQVWGDVDKKLEEFAPGYAVLGARQPYVGVAGSILGGGLSWLSHEYGLMSDPDNMLDAQIVLADGRAIWAQEEPDLLWALRGGGGNFGVVTAFKLKARRYTSKIFSGYIFYPQTSIELVSKAVADFTGQNHDPKVTFTAYILHPDSPLFPFPRGIGFIVYDAHGKEHGRSNEGFGWALSIEGAIDMTSEMSLPEIHRSTEKTDASKGKLNMFMGGALVPSIDENFLVRMSDWFSKILSANSALAAGSYAILEILKKGAMGSSGSLDATAFPHAGQRHVLQLGTGFLPGSSCTDEEAFNILRDSYSEIAPGTGEGDFFPNLVEDFMDVSKIYGDNYPKLRVLKSKYDPNSKFNKGIFIPPF